MVLVVGQPMDSIVSALGALRRTLFLAGPLTLLLSAGGGLFLARRALKPVDRMIQTTREIEETDLARRIDVATNDELGRLAATLNAMLERLESAFHRQRQFTDDASHELRTPLSVIEAEASLALRRKRPADDYRDALAIVVEEARNMNRLIDQLLTLARADAGEEALALESLDLSEIAEETIATMRPLAEEKDVTLIAGSMTSAAVNADRVHLKRLLANLIDNAIRYTAAGGSVTVSVAQDSESVTLTVDDTGIGIPAGHLPHIFERFYRVDKARSRAEGGSGLGLAICKQIAEEHGGSISVESDEGEGTRFAVRMPSA
jgi:heavy metal sensor kinase